MKYILFLSLLFLTFSSQAMPTCSKNGTRVLYSNGIHTSYREADDTKDVIENLILEDNMRNSRVNIDLKNVVYELAYNYDETFTKDILEAIAQRLPQSYLDALSVSNAYAAYSYFLQGKLITSISTSIIDSINLKKLEIISNFSKDYVNLPLYNQTINDIQIKYNAAFARGERVFAISHSQGGLFMNDVYNSLPESDNKKKYFSGFQIASVLGAEMNSHFGYATNSKDFVVNIVRDILGALPANLDTPFFISTNGDLFINHGILTTYLYDSSLKEQVIAKLIQTANLLESNCPKAVIKYTKNNLQVNFDSTDTGNPTLDGLTYTWDFGDGFSQATDIKNISHNYANGGNYTIILKVNDRYGNSDTAQTNIQVGNVKPILWLSVGTYLDFNNNISISGMGSVSKIPLNMAILYYLDFGDGNITTILPDEGAYFDTEHSYATPGRYQISLKMIDVLTGIIMAQTSLTIDSAYIPVVTILDQPFGIIQDGESFSYTFKCNNSTKTFDKPYIYIFASAGDNFTCTGFNNNYGYEYISATFSSLPVTYTINCKKKTQTNCMLSFPVKAAPVTFVCSVLDLKKSNNWYYTSVSVPPISFNFTWGCQ